MSEQFKQGVRNSSMNVLKDVQKLLQLLKENNYKGMTTTSNTIAQHSSELIDSVQEVVTGETELGKQVLDTMKQTKEAIVSTIKSVEGVVASTESEDCKNKLRNDAKVVAGLIKTINQQINSLTVKDTESHSATQPVKNNNEASKNSNNEKAEQQAVDKLKEQTQSAEAALKGLEQAACKKDQPQLVSNAKNLSSQCGELLQQARRAKLDSLGDNVKECVLNVIEVAKHVYKSNNDEALQKKLSDAVATTSTALKTLREAFEKSKSGSTTPTTTAGTGSSPNGKAADSLTNSAPTDSDEDSDLDLDGSAPPSPAMGHTKQLSNTGASPAAENSPNASASRGTDVNKPTDLLSPKDASKQLQKEFSSRDPEKVFKVQEQLGEGASGAVFKAIHRETKKVVAIKKMQVGVNNITSTVKEIKIMKDLKSPYTLKYYGCYQKDDSIWIIMEFCDGGSLQDIIDAKENDDVCLTEDQIAQITTQVLHALEYLHSMKKIHRDIKAGNILVNSKGMAKLADFGISAQQVGDEKRTTTIGSSYWMAPETLMGGGYDSKADIWSLGITVMEMAEGIPPLIEEQPHKAAFRIVNDPPPKLSQPTAWSPVFNDFLARCLIKNPDKRPTAAELLKHPFIAKSSGSTQAVVELLQSLNKDKKKKRSSFLQKKDKVEFEDEATLNVYLAEDSKQKANLLVAGHVTVEDVIRQCSDTFKLSKEVKDYTLYIAVDEGTGKLKEKQLGLYDYPVKLMASAKKKLKKSKTNEPIKFILK